MPPSNFVGVRMPKYLIFDRRLFLIKKGEPKVKGDPFSCTEHNGPVEHFWNFDPETDIVFENYWHARRHMIRENGKW